jgi:UDP-N-acetylmuramate dehydrogenase
LKKNDLKFGYRTSVFKQKKFKTKIITSVIFELHKTKKVNIEYKDLKEYFVLKKKKIISLKDVRKALQEIRGRKFPDLSLCGTVGSFFKNTIVKKIILENVKQKFPEVVYFSLDNGTYKISTAWLIDKACGLKGFREGNVGLYENQSLVIVNFGKTTAKEILAFKDKIKEIVFKKTGVAIEEEVIVL